MDSSPFHPDELTAQSRAGAMARGASIRNFIPDQHRSFFAMLPYVFIATADKSGWPLATMLSGRPGFVQSPDRVTLSIEAAPVAEDPAAGTLRVGEEVGILGIDFATRRRNRANGRIGSVDDAHFTVEVRQSFSNCPQYIQRRAMQLSPVASKEVHAFESLDDGARAMIERSDTFFVASRSRSGAGASGGADISHRGGRPGFVRVEGDTLSIPDFRGNRYFNTLGNLSGDPRAALLFVDFETGDLLQLQGMVEIDWSEESARRYEGAERLWYFRMRRGWRRRGGSPVRGSFIDYSPSTLLTSTLSVANS